jgi:hypothetical protein
VTSTLDDTTTAPAERHGFWTWPRALGVGVFVIFAAYWVYLFAFTGDYRPAGYLNDRTFPAAAEPICRGAMQRLDALPPARTARTATQRAGTVDQADAILRDMIRRLHGVVPDTADRKFIDQWLDDYGTFVGDRDEYAQALRRDPGAEYLVTKKYGQQISVALDNYAQVNHMDSCTTPNDV